MKCEKCGHELEEVKVNMFNYDGSDRFYSHYITEAEEDAAVVETTQNWTGYELSEDEMVDTIECPHCGEFPFKSTEIQVYNVVRLVMFRTEEGTSNGNEKDC